MKKIVECALVFLGMLALCVGIRYGIIGSTWTDNNINLETEVDVKAVSGDAAEEYDETKQLLLDNFVDGNIKYSSMESENIYEETDQLCLATLDTDNYIYKYELPSLTRMSEEDTEKYLSDIQVLKRIKKLGIDTDTINYPDINWKSIYNDSIKTVKEATEENEEVVEFDGQTASELNTFLTNLSYVTVSITSDEINLDETIKVPSNVSLVGNGVELYGDCGLDYAFLLDNVSNVLITNFNLNSGYANGLYVVESDNILLHGNEIIGCTEKAICVMGTCQYVNIVANYVHDNLAGALFLNGKISNCIIEGNEIVQNMGARNLMAAIALSSNPIEDLYTSYNDFQDEYLYDLNDCPNNNVIINNTVECNYSSGIYSHGGYQNYIISNYIEGNEKEGMCLDYGTFGTYVYNNTLKANGNRDRQSDDDLEADFVLEAGRLDDGSSPYKLPGLSLDNAAYNIICDNNVEGNAGSGIKMVRSAYRNIIISNLVTDNNAGANDDFHGFGIELGYAAQPDEEVKGLDFTPDYENIIARNIISGQHYSGIFLGEDVYCNDLIDNVIMDCTDFGVENHSVFFNSGVGNNCNVENLEY